MNSLTVVEKAYHLENIVLNQCRQLTNEYARSGDVAETHRSELSDSDIQLAIPGGGNQANCRIDTHRLQTSVIYRKKRKLWLLLRPNQ